MSKEKENELKGKKEVGRPGNRDIFVKNIKQAMLEIGFFEKEADKLAKIIFIYYHSGVRFAGSEIDVKTVKKANEIMDDLAVTFHENNTPPMLIIKMFFDIICLLNSDLPVIEGHIESVEVQ